MAAVGAILLPMLLAADASSAASRVCRQLEVELAGKAGGGVTSAQFRKYDRAVNAQRKQLAIANARARRVGCGFSLLSRAPELCGSLNAQIDRMESNLVALERKRDQLGRAGKKRSRATILAALEANGCRGSAAAARKSRQEKDGDVFSRLFGSRSRQVEDEQPLNSPPVRARERATSVTRILNPSGETTVFGPPGEFSTMCVRTCDGYYFPISPNSTAGDFERDQKNCETTCPGAQVQLYYRPAGDEATDTMMSVAGGEPYSSLPAAYLYRDLTKPRPPACGCSGGTAENPNFSIIGGGPADAVRPDEPVIPKPAARPDPGADPETLANARGGLDVETIRRILKPQAPVPTQAEGERKVRVVGPVFLPDPEGAIDLKAPAPQDVR